MVTQAQASLIDQKKMDTKDPATSDRELHLNKILDAQIELVWRVFTEPDHLANWWGPDGFTNTIETMDVKPGGDWVLTMHGPDGKNYKNRAIYREVIPLEKIVFDHFAPAFTTTLLFEPRGTQTNLSWKMVFETVELFTVVVKTFKADEGLVQNINKLADYLSKVH